MATVFIKLTYFLRSLQEWRSVELSPDEYFDPIDESEVYEVDSVPRNNDLINYFFQSVSRDIEKIKAEITDPPNKKRIVFHQCFWNNQKNWHLERVDYEDDKKTYRILITRIKSADIPKATEIIRAIEKDGFLEPEYHGLITDQDDGSQTEQLIFPEN